MIENIGFVLACIGAVFNCSPRNGWKRWGCASHSSQQQDKGELEYGSILSNGEDWRLRKFDAGMGETEYRIFKNEVFFAQFDNRKDADTVMVAMTCSQQGERDKVLDYLDEWVNSGENLTLFKWELREVLRELRQGGE